MLFCVHSTRAVSSNLDRIWIFHLIRRRLNILRIKTFSCQTFHRPYFKTHLICSKEKKHSAAFELHISRFPGADIRPRLEMRPAVSVKYGSINRRSAINFNTSDLIYPIIAVGCLPLSNVLWRWAFHILYCFFFPPPALSSSIKTRRCLVKVKSMARGMRG